MLAVALAFIQPAAALLKPYWKYIVIAAALIGTCWFTHSWYEGKLDAAYNRGVAATEAKDAKVLELRAIENATIVAELKTSAAVKQAELEGKLHANEIVADSLRIQLRTHRVCSDERSGRSVPGDSGSASKVDGAAKDEGPVEPDEENPHPSVGDDLVTIGEACQENTDKLVSLQGYVTDLMSKLKKMARGSRRAQ